MKGTRLNKRIRRAIATGAIAVAVGPMLAACSGGDDEGGSGDLTQVKLQLQWLPQAQFAGYYAAVEQLSLIHI